MPSLRFHHHQYANFICTKKFSRCLISSATEQILKFMKEEAVRQSHAKGVPLLIEGRSHEKFQKYSNPPCFFQKFVKLCHEKIYLKAFVTFWSYATKTFLPRVL